MVLAGWFALAAQVAADTPAETPSAPAAQALAATPTTPAALASPPAAAGAPKTAAQAAEPAGGVPVALRSARALGMARGASAGSGPVYAKAEHVQGEFDDHATLQGSVEVRREGLVLRSDRAGYAFATDELDARGAVRLVDRGAAFEGPSLRLRLESQTGEMPNASYSYAAKGGRGESRLIEFLGADDIRMHDATYTTCQPGDPAWWIRANTIDIDRSEQEAVAHNTTLYFEGVPVLVSPYFDLPLGDQRRSGLLTPGFYQSSRVGQEFIQPFYLNIAPNRDYTLTPDVMPRRGVLLGNEFRFLEPQVRGQLDYDLMPNDRTTGNVRDHIHLQTQYAAWSGAALQAGDANIVHLNGLSFALDYNKVSDDNYLIDFTHNIVAASPEVLPQEAALHYVQPYWDATLRLAKSQTLVSLLAPYDPGPYQRAPEFTLNTMHNDWHGFDIGGVFDATRFQHPAINPLFVSPVPSTKTNPSIYTTPWFSQDGTRFTLNPTVSYPVLAPGWFVVPKVQWNYTHYALDPTFNAGDTSANRGLPIASVDSGLVFERPARWLGKDVRQTLEPRVYYASRALPRPKHLPNYESADADFNFAQLFTENAFTGGEPHSQVNQVITGAGSSRIIDDETGAEAPAPGAGPALLLRLAAGHAARRGAAHQPVVRCAGAGPAHRWAAMERRPGPGRSDLANK